MELQAQVARLGIPAFVRMCAEESGIVIPEEEYESFDPAALAQALSRMPAPQEDAETPQEAAEPSKQRSATSTRSFWTASVWTTRCCNI